MRAAPCAYDVSWYPFNLVMDHIVALPHDSQVTLGHVYNGSWQQTRDTGTHSALYHAAQTFAATGLLYEHTVCLVLGHGPQTLCAKQGVHSSKQSAYVPKKQSKWRPDGFQNEHKKVWERF